MDSTYYLSLFLEEGRERLQQLAELLVALERTPGDLELLNDVFRTVHTFKGMADTMDFADLVALTHAMEGVLDALRRGRLELDPPLTRLMLRCLDALEGSIEAIEDPDGAKPMDFGVLEAQLAIALAHVHPATAEVREAVVAAPVAPPPMSEASKTYRIEIQLDPACYMKSARALVITSSLEMLGPVLDVTPSLEELEWEDSGDRFAVVLVTDAGSEAIRQAIADLSEIASSGVEEVVQPAKRLHADNQPLENEERQELDEALASGRQALWIEVVFGPSTTNKASRASTAMARLADFGRVVRCEPELSALEQDGQDEFRVLFTTAEDPATLRESLLPITDILTVGITPYAESNGATGPDPARASRPDARPPRRARSLRIEAERLDGLMDLLGALSVGQNRLGRVLERQGVAERADVRDALDDLGAMTGRLREALMSLRLVPLDSVFARFPRVVRDLSHELGKQVEFVTGGGDLPLDRLLVDELGEILVHLIRNALDHGLETPAERQAAGKSSSCRLELEARLEGAQVLIRVADDGRGVDVARVREKAVARGLVDAREAEALPAERVMELIFLPGVSTTERANRLSGRGVGLDAVKNRVDGLGGFVHVESRPGHGTTFELRFPLPRDFLARAAERQEARAQREG